MSILKTFPAAILMRPATCVFVLASLGACGGGGGGGAALAPAQDRSAADDAGWADTVPGMDQALMISEVASNYYSNDVAWLELYNPNPVPLQLSSFTLRTSHINPQSGALSYLPMSFSLPEKTVPAHGYFVVAARVHDKLANNEQIAYIGDGSNVPFWNANGSVELVSAGKTVDFVRFGSSNAAPLSAHAWKSGNVPALPSGPEEHGKSIVRLQKHGMPDTDTAADWALVNFATPAGQNDIVPGVVDSDRDGIPDSAKIEGNTFGGLDLYAMGARPGRRDLFMEIDYMQGTDVALTPQREALQKVVDAFAQKNIAVHLDTGDLHEESFNLGGGNPLAFAKCIELASSGSQLRAGCTSFYDYKSENFDVRRKQFFHYAIFGYSQNPDGSPGASGVAEVNGNDLIVTIGANGLNTRSTANRNLLINVQASTLMHELGHNLGLLHGGHENVNYKPNHYSIMNYMYQFGGLSSTPDSLHAAERYYLVNGMKGKTYCNLVENSPCSDNFIMSYSDGKAAPLDERKLSEAANIGRGAFEGAYADWNNDSVLSAGTYARNLNPQYDSTLGVLKDFNEWAALRVSFARGYAGSNTGDSLNAPARLPRHNPMNNDPRLVLKDEPLPAHVKLLIEELKEDAEQHQRKEEKEHKWHKHPHTHQHPHQYKHQ